MAAMAARRSAGVLLFRRPGDGELELLLVHPGGPFWARKDEGAWSIPKGEYEDGQDARAAALREFAEEIGRPVEVCRAPGATAEAADSGIDTDAATGAGAGAEATVQLPLIELGTLRQPGGKIVTAWAAEGDLDPAAVVSNTFELEWPPRSGKRQQFPEIDRAEWFTVPRARTKILRGQTGFIDALLEALG